MVVNWWTRVLESGDVGDEHVGNEFESAALMITIFTTSMQRALEKMAS